MKTEKKYWKKFQSLKLLDLFKKNRTHHVSLQKHDRADNNNNKTPACEFPF
jgi:hypothetical protein